MQRSRYTHPRLLNGESVPQNVPGSNPKASLRAAWEHINTIIPEQQGVQAWDRYAYTSNNPVRYTDPSGHYEQKNGYTHDYDEYTPFNRIISIKWGKLKETEAY